MQRSFWTSLVLAAAVIAGGCDNDVGITPTQPPPTTTETFTGTITVNGAMTHTFAVSTGGVVTATLSAVSPDSTIPVGFSLGTWNVASSTCTVFTANDAALQGQIHTASASGLGTLCVRVYDAAARLTGPLQYTVTVVHP